MPVRLGMAAVQRRAEVGEKILKERGESLPEFDSPAGWEWLQFTEVRRLARALFAE